MIFYRLMFSSLLIFMLGLLLASCNYTATESGSGTLMQASALPETDPVVVNDFSSYLEVTINNRRVAFSRDLQLLDSDTDGKTGWLISLWEADQPENGMRFEIRLPYGLEDGQIFAISSMPARNYNTHGATDLLEEMHRLHSLPAYTPVYNDFDLIFFDEAGNAWQIAATNFTGVEGATEGFMNLGIEKWQQKALLASLSGKMITSGNREILFEDGEMKLRFYASPF